ncbi:hypothetical protein STSP_27720 [Streptomyces jeddahensis]|uniref:Uncharacterized protein n=1 Tax=Streptomyces jeddahensis TaxID=1716141 RepID=A0A177HUA5_9ACTN|nr:hypothetical protein STSP_27720 [Streptomyces jeddahensis]
MRGLRDIALGGLLLTSWAVDAGWSRASVFRRLKEEGWSSLGGSVWAEPGVRPDFPIRLRAVQLAAH